LSLSKRLRASGGQEELKEGIYFEGFFFVTLYVQPREEAQGSDKGCFRE
jgi:hypothetical protein